MIPIGASPITNGKVQETGDFELDGVSFPAAEVQIEFMDSADGEGAMFPTSNLVGDLEVPGVGTLKTTMINVGIPTIFVNADQMGAKIPSCRKPSTATTRPWPCSEPSEPTAQ